MTISRDICMVCLIACVKLMLKRKEEEAMKWVLIITGTLITFVFIIPYILITMFWSSLDTELSLSDFESKEKALEFVNGHLPIKLPEDAKIEKLEYFSWMDFHLEAAVTLPPKEAAAYGEKIEAIKSEDDNEKFGGFDEDLIYYNIEDPPVVGTIAVNSKTGMISIKCSNPVGK